MVKIKKLLVLEAVLSFPIKKRVFESPWNVNIDDYKPSSDLLFLEAIHICLQRKFYQFINWLWVPAVSYLSFYCKALICCIMSASLGRKLASKQFLLMKLMWKRSRCIWHSIHQSNVEDLSCQFAIFINFVFWLWCNFIKCQKWFSSCNIRLIIISS